MTRVQTITQTVIQTVIMVLSFSLMAGCATHSDNTPTPPTQAESNVAATFRVASIQLSPSEIGNFSAMSSLVQKAVASGAQLVIFPESSILGWLNPAVFASAQPIPGGASSLFAVLAQQNNVWIAAGLAEQGAPINGNLHYAWDSGIVVNPSGAIVLHHRKYQVLTNAFGSCPPEFPNCQYTQGQLSDIAVVDSPFGRLSILVCADAYTYNTAALDAVKALDPQVVIVPWGVGAASGQCNTPGTNATQYAAEAAAYVGSAYFIGANATGNRPYGRFLPAVYCGNSGYANPNGTIGWQADNTQQIALFDVPLPD